MKLSIVSTLFLSQEHIEEFYLRLINVLDDLSIIEFEILLVDDGSPDNSLKIAKNLANKNNKVKVIELSRNFGHHRAMMTGLRYATGDRVFLIDSDLEEQPEYLKDFMLTMEHKSCDVVFGVQDSRKGNFFEKLSGAFFWKLINFLSGLNFSKNISTIRLMKKEYVLSLLQHEEQEIFIAGLWLITGYDQSPFIIQKTSKLSSTYSLNAKIKLLVNAITSFSNKPLVNIFYLGVFILFGAISYIVYLVLGWFFFISPIPGWTSVIASVWFLGGLIISFIGILGIYLSKIFIETKKRPYSIVKKVHEK